MNPLVMGKMRAEQKVGGLSAHRFESTCAALGEVQVRCHGACSCTVMNAHNKEKSFSRQIPVALGYNFTIHGEQVISDVLLPNSVPDLCCVRSD